MHARILKPADYRTMPWKNGLGTTHEILVQRDPAWVQRDSAWVQRDSAWVQRDSADESRASGSFVWRLSIAEVSVASPFSAFPGCDRTILLLDGDGMLLDSGSAGSHLLNRRYEPYSFQGEWATDCRLLGGPCRDFNVMVDRSRARSELSVMPLSKEPRRVPIHAATLVLFTLKGNLRLKTEWPSAVHELPEEHTLVFDADSPLDPETELTLSADSDEAIALLVALTRL